MQKLKSTDLRIGNYVCAIPEFPILVESINDEGINLLLTQKGRDYSKYDVIEPDYTFDELQPIKLTEEWLLKAGLIKNGFNRYDIDISKSEHQTNLILIDLDGGKISIRQGLKESAWQDDICVFWNRDFDKYYYVHQLQNLFWLATKGEELTFKD